MLKIYTSNFNYKGSDRLDITVKTGSKIFAPSWQMVMDYKNGDLSKTEYIKQYIDMMRFSYKNNLEEWKKLLNMKKVTLVCYCKPGNFCHRVLLAEILEKCGAKYIGEKDTLLKESVKRDALSKESADYQKIALSHLFNTQPESNPAIVSKEFTSYDRKPFFEDSWIFAGTENDIDPIMEDVFDSMAFRGKATIGSYNRPLSEVSDYEYTLAIMKRCKAAVPLSYGEIGGQAIDAKFKNKQLTRQIWEDCQSSGGAVRIPQLTQPGACTIPSQYRIEEIARYANVTLKQANILSKIYQYLGLDFKAVIRINKAVRRRKTAKPWDIPVNKNGLTLLQNKTRERRNGCITMMVSLNLKYWTT